MSRRRVVTGSIAGILVLAGAAGCGGETASAPNPPTSDATTSTGPASTPTTVAPVVVSWPLTGLPAEEGAPVDQVAIVAKVDNSPQARPHAGINQADLVYEIQVEGITRFMEVFHTNTPDRLGPVRSARSSDINLLADLNRPLLIWSGADEGVAGEVLAAQSNDLLVDVGHSAAEPEYTRDTTRDVDYEHTLFVNAQGIRTNFTPADTGPPSPVFARRTAGETLPATAIDFPGVTIDFGLNVRVDYVWDAERGGWDRFQVDQRHPRADAAFVDEAGVQVAPPTVVILNLQYTMSGNNPVAQSIGEGSGLILTEGKGLLITWSRENPDDPWTLTDPSTGAPVALPNGPTWVALPEQNADQIVAMSPDEATSLLATRK